MQSSDYAPAARRRRPTGQLYVRRLKGGEKSYGVRYQWQGRRYYEALGHSGSPEEMTEAKALKKIEELMARVYLGDLDPGKRREPEATPEETFDEFARA